MTKLASLCVVLGALARPAAADPRPLDVIVHGSIDALALRTQLAGELGGSITIVDHCSAACLEISVAFGKATVAYTAPGGAQRTRMIDLGEDRAHWPVVITLLAGNLVRDEAADVLAQLPAPEIPSQIETPPDEGVAAPETPEAPGEPAQPLVVIPPPPDGAPVIAQRWEPEPEHLLLGVGLVPGLSTEWTHVGRVNHLIGVHAIAGVSAGSDLLSIGGVADILRGNASGVQLAGVVATARRVSGIQLAGVAAVAGDLDGVQLAGTAAVARGRGGIQVGGVAAVAGSADLQLAGVAAVSHGRSNLQVGGVAAVTGDSSVLQLGGVATVAHGTASIQVAGVATTADRSGFQVAGVTNVARTANVQIGGVVNVASRLHGVQVAPINVAREVEGIQVGVINVGGSADGFSFGLINIVPGGRTDLEAAVDGDRTGTLLFRHGGNRWHNVYGIGAQNVDENGGSSDDVWMYGLGFGPSWKLASSRIDLELVGWQVNHGPRHSTDVSILGQLRLSLAYGIGPIALVAGGILNGYVTDDVNSPLFTARTSPGDTMNDGKVRLEVWPSVFVGVRL